MKLLTLIIVISVISGLFALPAMAYTPPGQSSDNATDIILWHGDNLTIASVNATVAITGLGGALTAAGEAGAQVIADEYGSIWDEVLLFVLAGAITVLAFWQREKKDGDFLMIVACPVNMMFGLYLASDNTVGETKWVMGVIITIIGLFCLFAVVLPALLSGVQRMRGK